MTHTTRTCLRDQDSLGFPTTPAFTRHLARNPKSGRPRRPDAPVRLGFQGRGLAAEILPLPSLSPDPRRPFSCSIPGPTFRRERCTVTIFNAQSKDIQCQSRWSEWFFSWLPPRTTQRSSSAGYLRVQLAKLIPRRVLETRRDERKGPRVRRVAAHDGEEQSPPPRRESEPGYEVPAEGQISDPGSILRRVRP